MEDVHRRGNSKIFRSAVLLLLATVFYLPAAAAETLPRTILWAWQRPEDLSQIDPEEFGIAYLACTIAIGERIASRPRVQPLKVPEKARLIPVIRIDTDRKHPPDLTESQAQTVAQMISQFARLPNTRAVQIDFDATLSERPFYASLLRKVRSLLPGELELSITALASWCLFDNWIQDLPVDEKIPMMFSLGADRQKVLLHFEQDRDFAKGACCQSLGLSLEDHQVNDVMIPLIQKRKIPVRVYFFTRTAWTDEKIRALRSLLAKQ